MSSIQFYGIDSIIKAAENRNCPTWGIFQGRQFLFKCERVSMPESLQLLETTLECLSHSTALYTIKFYEDVDKLKIKDSTPYDGSFNFKMIDEETRQERSDMYRNGSNSNTAKLLELEKKLDRLLEEEEEEEEEPETFDQAIIGMISSPSKLTEFFQAVKEGFSAIKEGQQVLTPAAPVMGHVTRMGQNNDPQPGGQPGAVENLSHDETQQKKMERLAAAIDILSEKDSSLVEHLEKLASVAVNNPFKFKMILTSMASL